MERKINIDILRIFSACMVLSVHICHITGLSFEVGAKGVQLFFILSGYLAFVSLEKNPDTGNYYKNRFNRIVPTYYLCLLIICLSDLLFGFLTNSFSNTLIGQKSLRTTRYIFFLQCIIPSDNWPIWNNYKGLWTMSSFFVFYLAAPFLHKFLKNFRRSFCFTVIMMFLTSKIAALIIRLLSVYPEISHVEDYAYMNPLTEIYCFMMGATLCLAIKENKSAFYSMVILFAFILRDMKAFPYECVFTVLVLIAVSFEDIVTNQRFVRIIHWISDGTFTLYLIHPIFFDWGSYIWEKIGLRSIFNGIPAGKYVYTFYLFLFCVGFSYLIYFGIIRKAVRVRFFNLK